MENAHPFMPTRAEGHDPNVCAAVDCGKVWNAIVHQPSLYLANSAPEGLVHVDRVSGGYMPRGFGLLHGLIQHPSDVRVKCHIGLACSDLLFNDRTELRGHLKEQHQASDEDADAIAKDPWREGESRHDWKKRNFSNQYSRFLEKVAEVQDSAVFCDHPNGFGPNGCPCGKGQPDEGEPDTVRNVDTGEDVEAVRCPSCGESYALTGIWLHLQTKHGWAGASIAGWLESAGYYPPSVNDADPGSPIWGHQVECPGECGNAFIKGNLRRHLQTVHQWTGDMWEDWAERTNFLELPTVPKQVLDQMSAFLNPEITMEQLMTDASAPEPNDHKLNPHELELILTGWWMDKAAEEVKAVVPKAVEYGATDLRDMGRVIAETAGRQVTDEEATELGIYFYALGKMARWTDAIKRGERVSDDTLHDLGVYVRMAQRTRDAGGWPGLPTT